MALKLYPFQETAVSWLVNTPRGILGSEMGLGKTAQTIVAAEQFPPPYHVICTASLKGNWKEEIAKWSKHPNRFQMFSYEFYRKNRDKIVQQPGVVICDEAHKLKNPRIITTKQAIGIGSPARATKRTWLVTGTPFPNNIADGYTLFSFSLKGSLGKYWEFAKKYGYVRDTTWGKKPYGVQKKMLPELMDLVRPILWRDTVEKNLAELPAYQEVTVPLEHTPKVKEICEMFAEHDAAVEKAIENETSLPNDPALSKFRRLIGIEKVPQAVKFIADLLEDEQPVVVFAYHREVVRGIAKGIGKGARAIDGDTPVADRQQIINDFQAGKIPCLVMSILIGGVGYTLTRASTAVFVELDWVPAVLEQAMARIRRIGQLKFCKYFHLVFKETLDESVSDTLRAKATGLQSIWKAYDGTLEIEPEEDLFSESDEPIDMSEWG